ncbi:MAG: preprotein translocase subunit SecE [Legionellales bacterium]|nr:preprotein translocase subunit SecE [Legionellales bacterium]
MAINTVDKKSGDWWKWLLSALLLLAGFYANYHFIELAAPIRVIVWIVLLGVLLFILAQTQQGQAAVKFTSEARVEMRKVVWPNRHDVTRSTVVILALVGLCSLILWVIDSGLMGLIGWLTGQRG